MPTHIKIPSVDPLVRYVANGVQTIFTYPFPIFASEDLRVSINGAPQTTGYTVEAAGQTTGGTVTFANAPSAGSVIVLERRLPLERMTDFLEGGDFSAQAINTELDYLTASLQQLERDMTTMIKYDDHETPANITLPSRVLRANKALGFDRDGNPIAVSLQGSMAAPNFTAYGTGAVSRTTTDKFSEHISVKDFGALGNGLSDDTLAFQRALAAHDSVYIPPGTYVISGTITLRERQSLKGAGGVSVIQCTGNTFNAVEIVADYASLSDMRINGGHVGIKLFGRDRPCVQTVVTDILVFAPMIGIQLDGYQDSNKPCYWNIFTRVLVEQPAIHGIHLTKTGAGDTPNANKFHACRVYSHGAAMTGHGVYVEFGAYNNAFIDCEANVHSTAQGCMTLGAGSNKTILINPYTESTNMVPNIKLEAGSQESVIYNLLSASNGAAIWDLSGGQYTAFNAGYPYKNRLLRTSAVDLTATLMRYDTKYIDMNGTITLDLSHSIHLVSSFGGALNVKLPKASTASGVMMMVKKIDSSANVITVTEDLGAGPDSKSYYLGARHDYVQMVSNGAEWFVISSNRAPGNTRFYDGVGLYDIDLAVDTYLLSSFGGALTARLPPANAASAIGRRVTIKKTDPSANVITVSEYGGSGPDGYSQPLNAQYKAITVVSNGAQWYIMNKF